MLTLSAKDYDVDGTAIVYDFESDAELQSITRRLSRTKTLDGGVEIYDAGYSASDRTFAATLLNLSKEDADNLQRMFRSYPLLTLSISDGVFTVAPESYRFNDGRAYITLLSKEIISG